jgi:hypothetical protein
LRETIERQFGMLKTVFEEGTVEEKRGLIAEYVHRVEAIPERNTVRISLYPPGVDLLPENCTSVSERIR